MSTLLEPVFSKNNVLTKTYFIGGKLAVWLNKFYFKESALTLRRDDVDLFIHVLHFAEELK